MYSCCYSYLSVLYSKLSLMLMMSLLLESTFITRSSRPKWTNLAFHKDAVRKTEPYGLQCARTHLRHGIEQMKECGGGSVKASSPRIPESPVWALAPAIQTEVYFGFPLTHSNRMCGRYLERPVVYPLILSSTVHNKNDWLVNLKILQEL